MSSSRIPWIFVVWSLPAVAGTLQGVALAANVRWWAIVLMVLCGCALQITVKDWGLRFGRGREAAAVVLGGYGPAVLACGLQSDVWFDRRALILATPIAMWLAASVVVDGVRRARDTAGRGGRNLALTLGDAASRSLFLGLHTSAIIILGFATVADEIHWGMIVLPFAVFRIAAGAADAILSGVEFERSVQETWDIAVKAYLVGSLWVVGWTLAPP